MQRGAIRAWLGVAAALLCVSGAAHAERVRIPSPYPAHPLFQEADETERPCVLPPQEFDDRSLWNANLWPGGVVHYTFDANVSSTNAERARVAMFEIETVSGVRFVPRTNQANYIKLTDSSGNSSFVGQVGGVQNVNLFNWSLRYIVIHELMHALGVHHEQQRSDRDAFVTINQSNIQPAYFSANFPKNGAAPAGPYDFQSIMHYDDCAFSTCCPAGSTCSCPSNCVSISALAPYSQFQSTMGNRSFMSQGDKDGLVSRYGVSADDVFAPNFSRETARSLVAGQQATGRLNTTSDWYKVELPGAFTLVVTVLGDLWAPNNATLRIRNASNAVVASALVTRSGSTIAANFSRGLTAGTYYLELTRSQPFGGPYILSLNVTCRPLDLTGDALVTDADFTLFAAAYNLVTCSDPGMPAGCPADVTKDGFVDDTDFQFFVSAYNTVVCP